MAATIIIGVYSLLTMRREFFPEVDSEAATITMVYPGATPEEIEESMVFKIEDALDSIDEIKRMIEQKMAGETGVASMLGTRRSSVIRSRALKAAVLGTIETAVEVNDQEMKKKSRACSIL